MAPEFDMKKVTTPLLLHMLGKELRFPRLFFCAVSSRSVECTTPQQAAGYQSSYCTCTHLAAW